LTVDKNGRPLRMILTGGQRHDVPQAPALLEGMKPAYVIADKGYDSRTILDLIREKGAVAVIPPRKNRKEQREYDRELYKRRNVIERAINKLKDYRRIATRYDRKAIYYLSFLHLAAAVTWPI
ncbi:MAG: IS5 family transposase, partial [Dehalococcoidia bacterium]|nr:IS5 family transposase [Dehalococcoidia bacterium]